ncbi:MAG: hypothetical protein PHT88_01905 [Candidatus Moranbacteria bacterium]|nr:hypothetical protein [Candidatus Moranbacteria bacterium]
MKNPLHNNKGHSSEHENIDSRLYPGIVAHEIAACLAHNNDCTEDIKAWRDTADRIRWERLKQLHPGLIRAIVIKVYDHKHGHIFIQAMLDCNVLHHSDIEMISIDCTYIHPTLVELLVSKVLEIGNQFQHPKEMVDEVVTNLRAPREQFHPMEAEPI